MDLFDSLEKRIKRDRRFDNPRSDLCKGASTLMRLAYLDQISLMSIPVEVGYFIRLDQHLITARLRLDFRSENYFQI